MSFFNRFRRELTSDQVLAANLRKAIYGYNEAMAAARGAGLSTMVYGTYSKNGSEHYVGPDYQLRLKYIARNSSVDL